MGLNSTFFSIEMTLRFISLPYFCGLKFTCTLLNMICIIEWMVCFAITPVLLLQREAYN